MRMKVDVKEKAMPKSSWETSAVVISKRTSQTGRKKKARYRRRQRAENERRKKKRFLHTRKLHKQKGKLRSTGLYHQRTKTLILVLAKKNGTTPGAKARPMIREKSPPQENKTNSALLIKRQHHSRSPSYKKST